VEVVGNSAGNREWRLRRRSSAGDEAESNPGGVFYKTPPDLDRGY
jgi:hypothetical protein